MYRIFLGALMSLCFVLCSVTPAHAFFKGGLGSLYVPYGEATLEGTSEHIPVAPTPRRYSLLEEVSLGGHAWGTFNLGEHFGIGLSLRHFPDLEFDDLLKSGAFAYGSQSDLNLSFEIMHTFSFVEVALFMEGGPAYFQIVSLQPFEPRKPIKEYDYNVEETFGYNFTGGLRFIANPQSNLGFYMSFAYQYYSVELFKDFIVSYENPLLRQHEEETLSLSGFRVISTFGIFFKIPD